MSDRYEDGGQSDGWENRFEPCPESEDGDWQSDELHLEQRRAGYRFRVKNTCSSLGFSLTAMLIMIELFGLALGLLSYYLASHAVMGPGGELFKLLHSDWFSVAGSNLLAYALVLPPVFCMMGRVPEVRAERKKMRLSKFFFFLVLTFGCAYLANIVGSIVNYSLAAATGRRLADMLPVSGLFKGMNWASALYVAVFGPVIEEYIFRWQLVNRLRPFGERAAIIFSAVMFGLMHGNISQFFYAAAIGIIFGYIAVKTGRLVYTVLLHIIFNSYSTLLSLSLTAFDAAGTVFLATFFVMLVPILLLGTMIASAVLLAVNWRRTRLRRGDWPAGVEYRDFSSALFLNPGVCLFAALNLGAMCFYAFFA